METPAQYRTTPLWIRFVSQLVRRLPRGRYRALQALRRITPPPFVAQMRVGGAPVSFTCDLRDSIAREVCYTGRYEPQETALVSAILEPGMKFVDVGANWGYFTLVASHLVGARGRVLALEPDLRLFEMLNENIERNRLPNVAALQVAATAQREMVHLEPFDAEAGNFGLSRLRVEAQNMSNTIDVQGESLAVLLIQQGFERVGLLKMDIEGAESIAMRGLEPALAVGRIDRILLELHPDLMREFGGTVDDLVSLLTKAGYRGWCVDHSPEASRRAAYARAVDVESLLQPIGPETSWERWGTWPHTVWAREGVELMTAA